jgi:putative glycosyltransferase (TIGR04372 family)
LDDRPFEELARHVVTELGGQVVCLGDPGTRPFDLGPDFVDLRRPENGFMLQAMAISRARFVVTTPSGSAQLPGAFDVPYAIANSLSILGVWTPAGTIMPNHLIDPQGRRVDIRRIVKAGRLDWESVQAALRNGCRVVENTAAELMAVAQGLFERTSDCLIWRGPATEKEFKPPNSFGVNQPYRHRVSVVEFPEHWPSSWT